MSETNVLIAARRSVTGKQVRRLRREGQLPGVVYGHGVDPFPVQMEAREAGKSLSRAGQASLLALNLEGEEGRNVLVREVQRDTLTRAILHVDLYQVRMDEEIRLAIPVLLRGKAPAVREKDGVLVQGVDEIEIECLTEYLQQEGAVGNRLSALEGNRVGAVAIDRRRPVEREPMEHGETTYRE